jgi:uncharacterized protein
MRGSDFDICGKIGYYKDMQTKDQLKSLVINSLFIFALGYLIIRFAPPISLNQTVTQKSSFFTASGTGKVAVVPDMAILNLGVTDSARDAKALQSQVNLKMNALSEKLKSLGIDDKDIKTTSYNLYPNYDYQSGTGKITGYNLSVNLEVKVKNLDNLNGVLDTSIAQGANTVGQIQLTVNDDRLKDLQRQAREDAVKEAKEKANSLAGAAGLTLGRLVNVDENNPGGVITPMFYQKDAVSMGGAPEASRSNIQTGTTDIVTTVTLYYETK